MLSGNEPIEETILEAGSKRSYWRALYKYRELLYFLAWRDILVRYKQTVLGIIWAVLRPALMMAVFTVLFGRIVKLKSPSDVPYALLVFAGLLPWQFFATAVQQISESLVQNANLISKIYFPRLLIPVSTLATSLVDLVISLGIFVLLMAYYEFAPHLQILFFPFFLLLGILLSIGIGLFIATLNVYYRDFRYLIPFAIQLGLYISPVGFSSTIIPEKWRLIYSLNPMVGVIDGFRWCLLGQTTEPYWPGVCMAIIITFFMLVIGFRVFRNMERNFADRV